MPHRSASGVLSILVLAVCAAAQSAAQPVADTPYLQQRAVRRPLTDTSPRTPVQLPAAPPMPAGIRTDVYALASNGAAAIGTDDGVHEWRDGRWSRIALRNGDEGWDPRAIVALAYDTRGRLWFASSQGVGVREESGWRFLDPARGLPVLGLTSLAAGPDGSMWVGSSRGAIRIVGDEVEYRQGTRWLPDDRVRAIHVDSTGTAWFETAAGVGGIASTPTTLADKAEAFEAAIDRHHRRTPYGFVIEAHLTTPGDPASATTRDSDNDGLWTSMYGAAECFAFAARRDGASRQRARRAFEALRFLVDVTRGGSHAPPDGFPARSILPTSGRDPNATDNADRDRAAQQRDTFWKILTPRWPRSADGQWFWKSDTSSDELDGHYFFYALYHDLVAGDDAERAEVAAVVRRITDHLLSHDYALVDHDGTPTRWAVFGPDALNRSLRWGDERGLNSLSMLTYLRIAHHVTGDSRYDLAARDLVSRHGYAVNLLYPKYTHGVGGGNQSDDEMAFMNYYHLIKYEPDPVVRATAARSLHAYWQLERPERNPFFNLVAAVSLAGLTYRTAFDDEALSLPVEQWRDDTLDTLRRFPLDLVDHAQRNSHRLDLLPLPTHVRPDARVPLGVLRRDGKVLPIDERTVFHWNVDPYVLDYGGQQRRLADGTSFLLPYYMALHHGVIARR